MLTIKDLSFHYHNGRPIFKDVNFSLDRGEVFSILGVNGAGKSTLLNCVANLYTPQMGEILVNGESVRKMKLTEIAKKIGYVPQSHNAVYAFSVLEFVVMGRTPNIGILSSPQKKDYQLARKAMEQMHISHLADTPYTEISGGERQQAMIARVLTQEPQYILLDEPTAHLDYGNQFRTVSLVHALAQKGFGVIMTTHMPDFAIILDDKVGILDRTGHLIVGTAKEIMTEDRLSDLYQIEIKTQYIDFADRNICVVCSRKDKTDFFVQKPSSAEKNERISEETIR